VAGDVLDLRPVCRRQDVVVDVAVRADLFGVDDREVGVDAQTAVPFGVEHAKVLQDLLQFREERAYLLGPAEVGFRDDLHQGRSGAVIVDEGVLGGVDRPALVLEAAGILFEMRPLDADRAALAVDTEREFARLADRCVVLGDLEVLREVGVEVVLPVKAGPLGDLGVDGRADLDGGLDCPLVEHGQRTGEAQTDRTRPAVGFVAALGRTATEDLGRRLQLDVDLEPDDDRQVTRFLYLRHYPGVRWPMAKA